MNEQEAWDRMAEVTKEWEDFHESFAKELKWTPTQFLQLRHDFFNKRLSKHSSGDASETGKRSKTPRHIISGVKPFTHSQLLNDKTTWHFNKDFAKSEKKLRNALGTKTLLAVRDPNRDRCRCRHVRRSHGQDLPWDRCGNTACKHPNCKCQAFRFSPALTGVHSPINPHVDYRFV